MSEARAFRGEPRRLWTHPGTIALRSLHASVLLCASVFQNPSLLHVGVGGSLPGPYLRTALTGRASSLGADPGLHPGLVELALQAEIAGGSGQWAVGSSVGPSRMVQHVEDMDSFRDWTPSLSPLRFTRVIRAICCQNPIVFLTTDDTDDTDLKEQVTAIALLAAGAADPTWRCPVRPRRQRPRGPRRFRAASG